VTGGQQQQQQQQQQQRQQQRHAGYVCKDKFSLFKTVPFTTGKFIRQTCVDRKSLKNESIIKPKSILLFRRFFN